jgi:endo-1,4-beta-xylanase
MGSPKLWLKYLILLVMATACSSRPFIPPTPQATPSPHTLRSLAEPRGLHIGVAVNPNPLELDRRYSQLVSTHFNAISPENEMKWEFIHPERVRYDFTDGDRIVRFAQENDQAVYAHLLVWDSQLPQWLTEGGYSREEWIEILREHIYSVVGHYRGQIYAWDVVNEPLTDEGLLRDTIWLRNIGPEYIALALRFAHEADPNAGLFINEFNAEGLSRKSEAMYALAQGLLNQGLPLHAIGMQMHIYLRGDPTHQDLAANLARLGALGLEVYITEMDVQTYFNPSPPEERLRLQGERYSAILATCLQAPNCKAFITWGVTDATSWIPSHKGHPDVPLLFDEAYQPKPAFTAVRETLQQK